MPTATAAKKAAVVPKFPKTIGQMVDFIAILQEERDAIKSSLAAKESAISAAMEHMEANFDAGDLNGAKGSVGIAERKSQVVYNGKDWDAIYAYIKKNNAFELLHKRLTAAAVEERAEAGKPVPGVESFTRHFIQVKPIKTK